MKLHVADFHGYMSFGSKIIGLQCPELHFDAIL